MTPRRVPELDALRGLAAVGIVLFHFTMPGRANDAIFYTGAVSLELFFVLSGFLITTIILANCRNDGFLMHLYVPAGSAHLSDLLPADPRSGRGPLAPSGDLLPGGAAVLPDLHAKHPAVLVRGRAADDLPDRAHLVAGRRGAVLHHLAGDGLPPGPAERGPARLDVHGGRRRARAYGFSPQILIGRCDGFALGGLLAAVLSDADRVRRRPVPYRPAFGLVGFAALNYLTWGQVLLGQKPFTMGRPRRRSISCWSGSSSSPSSGWSSATPATRRWPCCGRVRSVTWARSATGSISTTCRS